MSGSKIGGRAAAKTNKERYGKDYYENIGVKGGSVKGLKKGFAANLWCDKPCSYDDELGDHMVKQCAGKKGGLISRRKEQ